MLSLTRIMFLAMIAFVVVVAQQEPLYYQDDYANDNLYHDYAARQQEKQVGAPGMPWGKLVVAVGLGWMMGGKIHSGKVAKKLSLKHKQEQKELYTQYYNDVYTLKEQNGQLVAALEQAGYAVR